MLNDFMRLLSAWGVFFCAINKCPPLFLLCAYACSGFFAYVELCNFLPLFFIGDIFCLA